RSPAGAALLRGLQEPPLWIDVVRSPRGLSHPNRTVWRWEIRPAGASRAGGVRSRGYALQVLEATCTLGPTWECATLETAGTGTAIYGWHWSEGRWRRRPYGAVEGRGALRWHDVSGDGRPELLFRPAER
ncbi:MAG: hypothetical protein ACUVT1_10205, partial [Anaerolineae bacterium]